VNLIVKIVGGMATTAGEACKLTTSMGKDGYIVIFHWEDDCREKSDSTTAIPPPPPLFYRKILLDTCHKLSTKLLGNDMNINEQ